MSVRNYESITSRRIRIFISSTFQDMNDERDYLMKRTFPKLRKKARERDVALTEVDLRWGITAEEVQSGKVVGICFQEIDNSVPFFIGIIGNRYGWIPNAEDIDASTYDRFSQLKDYVNRGLSVTEMEIQYGVLEREDETNAFFYIKSGQSQHDYDNQKLRLLKEKISTNSRYPSSTYKSAEDLAQQIEKAFNELLDYYFPEGKLSEYEQDELRQRSYLNSLCETYIRDNKIFDFLDSWLHNKRERHLVLTGPSGIGKSALLANWIIEHSEDKNYKIAYYFIGSGGSHGSPEQAKFMLIQQIKRLYRIENSSTEDATDDLKSLFVSIPENTPLIIVLDAVNQLQEEGDAKLLLWMPAATKNVKILYTTLKDDRTMDVFKARNYNQLKIQPLNSTDRKRLIFEYLQKFGKTLPPKQTELISHGTISQNTLILKTILDELVSFGNYKLLDQKINSYLTATSETDFFQRLLASYEQVYGSAMVKDIFCLIYVSRCGLAENELLDLLALKKSYLWSEFYCAVGFHFNTKNVLVSFSHMYLRQAIAKHYMSNGDWEQKCRERLIDYFRKENSMRAKEELMFQYRQMEQYDDLFKIVSQPDVFMHLFSESHHLLVDYWKPLIGNHKYQTQIYLNSVNNLSEDKRMLFLLQLHQFYTIDTVQHDLALKVAKTAIKLANNDDEMSAALNMAGTSETNLYHFKNAEAFLKKSIDIQEHIWGGEHESMAGLYVNLSQYYFKIGDANKAIEKGQYALNIYLRENNGQNGSAATSYNNLSQFYHLAGNNRKAKECGEKAVQIALQLYGEEHEDVAIAYMSYANILESMGDLDLSRNYTEKALEILKNLYGDFHYSVILAYSNLALNSSYRGNYIEAISIQEKSLEILRKMHRLKHQDVSIAYNNLALYYYNMGNMKKAFFYQRKSEHLTIELLGPKHPSLATIYQNMANFEHNIGHTEKALEYADKAIDITKSAFEDNHPLVASAYINKTYFLLSLGQEDKVEKLLKTALNIQLEHYGEYHPSTASTYGALADAYLHKGYLKESIRLQEKALSIKVKIYGENHPSVANSYNNLAQAQLNIGDIQNAEISQQKSLEINLNLFGETSPSVAIVYGNFYFFYSNIGQIDKAYTYITKALEINKSLYGEHHPQVGTCYCNLGCYYHEVGDDILSLKYTKKSLEICREYFNDNHPDIAMLYGNMSIAYSSMGNTDEAIECNEKATTIMEDVYGKNHPRMATQYSNLAQDYSNMGSFEKAQVFNEKALKIRKRIYGTYHPDVAISYNNIACLYADMKNFSMALKYHKKALNIRLHYYDISHPDVQLTYNNIASTYSSLGQYKKAANIQQELLDTQIKQFGENDLSIAFSLNNLASYESQLGNEQQALKHYLKSLKIRLKKLGKIHPDIALSYNNIGNTYSNIGNFKKAITCFGKAIAIEQSLPENHKNKIELTHTYKLMAYTYSNMRNYEMSINYHYRALEIGLAENAYTGDIIDSYTAISTNLINLKRIHEAIVTQKKALELQVEFYGEDSKEVHDSCFNIGRMYGLLEQWKNSLSFHLRALKLKRILADFTTEDLAESLNICANTSNMLGNSKDAEELYKECLSVQESVYGSNSSELLDTYQALIDLYSNRGEWNKALEYAECKLAILNPKQLSSLSSLHATISYIYDALGNMANAFKHQELAHRFLEKTEKRNSTVLALSYNNLAYYSSELGNQKIAIEYQMKALKIYKRKDGISSESVSISLGNIAHFYAELNNFDKAIEFGEETLAMRLLLYGDIHPYVQRAYVNLSSFYKSVGNTEKADICTTKANEIGEKLKTGE